MCVCDTLDILSLNKDIKVFLFNHPVNREDLADVGLLPP